MMATGFIGLGDVGAPIAHRLLDGCIELVVFDVRARQRDPSPNAVMMAGANRTQQPGPPWPRRPPSGPKSQNHDIISNMSNTRFTGILTDACNDTFTDGITFTVAALTAEVNGGLR
jgi:hypothetical protein